MTTPLSKIACCLCIVLSACSLVRDLDDLEPRPQAADGGGGDGAASPSCPLGMVGVRFADGARFCIDSTEVSQAAYGAFLAQGSFPTQAGCTANTSFKPDDGPDKCADSFDPVGRAELPVVCVDHCDAATYCAWKGSRLCTGRSGTDLEPTTINDSTRDEWFLACGATRSFAPGEDPSKCVFKQATSAPVTQQGCATPDGVLNLSGNVSEWTGACSLGPGEVRCLIRGGNFGDTDSKSLRCEVDTSVDARLRTFRSASIGFRCCRDLR